MTIIPEKALSSHIAVVGMTNSGKTSTAKLLVESVVAKDVRVCIIDPLKSDWWGLTSSADGRRPGLPFHILGGPRGHVPLHPTSGKAIGEIVGNGSLRHSILDMADFEPGQNGRFFTDFASALFRHARGVVYLVVEEAHEFAPKERAGYRDENMALHWMKRLATGARSKGIRLVVCTQRIQKLHNDVLSSCDTVLAHRVTFPADQAPIVDWMKARYPDQAKAVLPTLATLKAGEAWVCTADGVDRRQFQKIKTFDNTATPTEDAGAIDVKTAPVDQEALRAIIGDAIAESEANDPKALKAKIAALEKQLTKPQQAEASADVDARVRREVEAALSRAHAWWQEQWRNAIGHYHHQCDRAADDARKQVNAFFDALAVRRVPGPPTAFPADIWAPRLADGGAKKIVDAAMLGKVVRFNAAEIANEASSPGAAGPRPSSEVMRPSAAGNTGGVPLSAMERALLTSLAQHRGGLTKSAACLYAGYKPSGDVSSAWGRFSASGWIARTADGVKITDAGLQALGAFDPLPTGAELRFMWRTKCDRMESALLAVLFELYPRGAAKSEIVSRAGYKPSGDVSSAWAKFNTLGWTQRTADGVRAADMWFD